jgi:hypothetical protein
MNRQLYNKAGIVSLDAGAPSIKYEGDIKPRQEVADVNLPLDVQGWFQSLSFEQQLQLLSSDIDEAYKVELRKLMGEAPNQQGIMNAMPRDMAAYGGRMKYGFGGKIGKALSSGLKKVGNVISDVVSSDVGKAALLATAGAYGLGMGPFAAGSRFGNIAGAGFLKNIGLPSLTTGKIGEMFSGSNLLKAGTLLGGSALMTKLFGSPQEAAKIYNERPQVVTSYLTDYYKQVNPDASDEEVADFISRNTAEYRLSDTFAVGGRVGYALGDTAQAAAGIAGLPLRQNPMGVNELDLRNTGGFLPPVGIKEKADDIPAMLSNNEFVFTADAVRGMGNGDVNVGAQRMYDMMKRLENGGRV